MADDGKLSQSEIDSLMDGDSSFDLDDDSGASKPAPVAVATKEKKKRKKPAEKQGMYSMDSDNMELLLDVQMTLSVELGRTKRNVKEVLSYGEGSIVELEKISGEPVDILVNGRIIGRGEVVVIDETYGVRVTEILDPYESLKGLN